MDFPQLLGAFYTDLASKADCQRAMNVYLSRIESGGGRGPYVMYKQFGQRAFKQVYATNGCRGMILAPSNINLFTIHGDTFFDILEDGTVNSSLGGLVNDGLPVSLDYSSNTLFIVSSNILYRINSGALTTPATPFIPSSVGVIAGIIVATELNTANFYFSLDDGATWAALDQQTAEAFPNQLVNLLIDHQELWLFGNRRTQVFVVGDDPNAPFDAIPSGVIEVGLQAKFGCARLDNTIFLYGSNKDGDHQVVRMNGYTPMRVSTHAVENVFRGYGKNTDAIMASFQLNGHSCLRLSFPSANNGLGATWHYDASLPPELAWTEAGWWNLKQGYHERHRSPFYTAAFGFIIAGDHTNGWLYKLTPDDYTDFGYPLRWLRRTPHITKENKQVSYRRLEVLARVGNGLLSPLWLHTYDRDAATFAANLATQVAGGNVTAAEALVLQAIYDQTPYTPLNPYPTPDTMNTLGFRPWGAYTTLSNGTTLGGPPEIEMRYSNDGGENFTQYSARSSGLVGQFNKRLFWNRLGKGRDRVWEFAGGSPAPEAIVGAAFDAEVGAT